MKELNIQKNGKPCIYSIKSKTSGKLYIGSATGHYRRKGQHYYMLRRNIHFNRHLQSAWNKYGEEDFEFSVLEFITDLSLIEERELYYIDKFNVTDNTKGYNIRRDCRTNLGKPWPLESRIKFSLSKKGKKITHLNYIEIAKKNMKKVIAIKINTNEKIIFNSIKEASISLKIERTSISKALHKVIYRAGSYYWDFAA